MKTFCSFSIVTITIWCLGSWVGKLQGRKLNKCTGCCMATHCLCVKPSQLFMINHVYIVCSVKKNVFLQCWWWFKILRILKYAIYRTKEIGELLYVLYLYFIKYRLLRNKKTIHKIHLLLNWWYVIECSLNIYICVAKFPVSIKYSLNSNSGQNWRKGFHFKIDFL